MEQRDIGNIANTSTRSRKESMWWCTCGHCSVLNTEEECLCCLEWDLRPGDERLGEANVCLSTVEDVVAMTNRGVLETFFRVPKVNWISQPKPAGAHGQLSDE